MRWVSSMVCSERTQHKSTILLSSMFITSCTHLLGKEPKRFHFNEKYMGHFITVTSICNDLLSPETETLSFCKVFAISLNRRRNYAIIDPNKGRKHFFLIPQEKSPLHHTSCDAEDFPIN